MPYVPPNGSAVDIELIDGYSAPAGSALNLEFDPSTAADVRQASAQSPGAAFGQPQLLQSRFIGASGNELSAFGRVTVGTDTPRIRPSGIDSTITVGTPEYVRWPRWVYPPGIEQQNWPLGTLRVRLLGGYNPPPGTSLVINWFNEPYSPPPATSLQIEFGALGYGYILPTMGDVSAFGQTSVAFPVGLRPAGIPSPPVGVPSIQTALNELRVNGFKSDAFGTANLQNKGVAVKPGGIQSDVFGTSYVWNLLQYLGAQGFNALSFGELLASGGVKQVTLTGIAAPAFAGPLVVNTTANQTARPAGIPAPVITGPSLSPRTVFAYGVGAPGFGTLLIQRNPSPQGFAASAYGIPAIEFKTKYLAPQGIEADGYGFPVVFDPTRKLLVSSVAQAGIFGDTRIANRSLVIKVNGTDYLEIPPWAYVENTRRLIPQLGWNSAAFGGLEIFNKSPSIAPAGFDAGAKPEGVGIGYSVRTITPAGINSMVLGLPVLTKTPELFPSGFAGAAGTPTVWRRVRTLEVVGRDSQQFGGLSVTFRYRFVSAPGFAPDRYGTAKIEHGRRTLLAAGMQHATYGTALVTNADRTISPASIFVNFATGHMVGGLRFLGPAGFDAAQFGTRVIPEIQQAYPLGFTGVFGLAQIINFRKVVRPNGITTGVQPADRWGTARAFNLRQYVTMFYDAESALNPPAWPQWTKIENRTRTVRAAGSLSSRVGDHQIANGARVLMPSGAEWPYTAADTGMISYRVRSLPLEGMEAPYISTWSVVRNDASVISVGGSVATLYGVPSLANTRRTYDRVGGFDSAWYGYPMVADRVRTLSFEGRYTIGPPLINLPEAKLYTRYVNAIGYDASGIGSASLSIHFTYITPRWTLQNLYGYPHVRNLTPEVITRGRVSEEFGNAFVRLEWRPVAPAGALTQLFGNTIVAFRDRTIPIAGIRAWAFGDKLTVIRTGAPPYSMQTVNLDEERINDSVSKPGQGIAPPLNAQLEQVSRPIINQQVVYVEQEDPFTLFGNHTVTANSIRVEPGYGEYLMGEPFIALKVRTLLVDQFPVDQVFDPEKPRLSPHTIYAVMEATQQAIANHPQTSGLGRHFVDGYRRQPGAIFGNTRVTLQNRVVNARFFENQWVMPGYGNAKVQLKRHFITPTGFVTFRAGWHTVPGTQTVTQFDSIAMSLYGAAKIERFVPPGPRSVAALGFNAQLFGPGRVDLFHREVKPQGHYATLMGTRKNGDTPYAWQGLRVGPLMPTIPNGFESEIHGEPWISLKVREMPVQGFDAFLSEYDLEAFDKRMRVTRSPTVRPSRAITPVGIFATEFAASDVKPGIHFIRPDGNADQYRKGAF